MRIKKYGITLNRLTEEDIELVRSMRNADHINKYMHYQNHITPEMQKTWFKSIDNLDNYYFVIEKEGQKIGLIHGKKSEIIDDRLIAEAGIFIWDQETYNTNIAVACSIIMADFTFYVLGIEETRAKVLKSNKKMLAYNHKMGYQNYEENEEVVLQKLDQKNYERAIEKVRYGLGMLTGDYSRLSMDSIEIGEEFRNKLKNETSNINEIQLKHFSKIIQKAREH